MNATLPPSVAEKISVKGLTVKVHGHTVIEALDLSIPANQILGIIGPANSGKTTFLRCLNRMLELDPAFQVSGQILLGGQDIHAPLVDLFQLRAQVGMVFASPITLPGSITDNVALGLQFKGGLSRREIQAAVEQALRAAYLWDEVKDRLDAAAGNLSGGQQQRLCLARALTLKPQVLLLDEPCSGLDPISTARIEEALQILKKDYTTILVTNNVKQAARVSDLTAFFLMGQLVEIGPTGDLFTSPRDKRTEDYVSGRFG